MVNTKQLAILKSGVNIWNKFREENPFVQIDLSEADLYGMSLEDVNFSYADLIETDLMEVDLYGSNFIGANLYGAKLYKANLEDSNFEDANLFGADLEGAEVAGADLKGVNFSRANLTSANLERADLIRAKFYGTNLLVTNLKGSNIGNTAFLDVDLSETNGLLDIKHDGPSPVATNTFQRSKGNIPEAFLIGCGLTDWEIESAKLYKPNLSNQQINEIIYRVFDLRASRAIQIAPLFISYSHADTDFVDRLDRKLKELGVRFWRDIRDGVSGRLEKQVDRAMRQNSTVILILSENAIKSDWVEHEAVLARKLEKEMNKDVLCPISLDSSWKTSNWEERLKEQISKYNVVDFSKWEDDNIFESKFNQMVSGLELFYK